LLIVGCQSLVESRQCTIDFIGNNIFIK